MRPASARREAKPPRKHARVDHQQHDPQRRNAEAPTDADHEGDPDDPNAEAKADAPAKDSDMNGSNDFSDAGTDDPGVLAAERFQNQGAPELTEEVEESLNQFSKSGERRGFGATSPELGVNGRDV